MTVSAFQEIAFELGGKKATVFTRPGVFGWQGIDPATALLIAHMQIDVHDTVLDLGCGCGVVGVAAAWAATWGRVYMVDCNVVALACAQRTVEQNRLAHAEVRPSDVADAVRETTFDVVVSHLPRGREVARQFIIDAAAVLRPGGRLYIAGHNETGIKPMVEFARQVFGNSRVLAYKKGCRVALCVKGSQTQVPPGDYHRWRTGVAQVGGRNWLFAAKPGIFSWQELDAGTRVLIETMRILPGDRVLDLGCGCGIIGTVTAQTAREVYLVDSDIVAVEATRRTLALNGIPPTRAHVLADDGADALNDGEFDLVVTNPPFHQGRQTDYSVAHRFIRDAARVLRPDGRFYLVANRFIRYEQEIARHFGQLHVAYEDNAFRVLLAQKPRR